MEVHSIFQALDAPFTNLDRSVEPIRWQSSDILVQYVYDLKIPAMAGSTVKYTFSTKIGDINFGTKFKATGQSNPDNIVAPMRVPSDIEAIKGTYKVEVDGTMIFQFDNSFSWFNPKLLTYSIQLFQPAFAMADSNRVRQAHRLLHTTIEDTRRAELRLITAQDRSSTLARDVASLEARIAGLQLELDNKRGVLKAARDEVDEMSIRIQYNEEKRDGLCIRCLDKKALGLMLSYLGKTPSSYLVSKYWKICVDENMQKTSGKV